ELVGVVAPKAVAVSFCITMVLLLVVFRRFRDSMVVMASLLVGLVTMAGAMAALGMKINFLNFVAFPISFGNGVDYAVNTMGRYVQERDGERTPVRDAIRRAVSETGGAVILCSLTTIIGYISLFASANKALNSFGLAMGISEVTCLGAAVLAMPAVMLLRIGRKDSAA
ncbi:MAG: MMPL family transporter, partial [Myxococcales bacterium]|nr:MMPL family transporter [Myxococcales bacterium]